MVAGGIASKFDTPTWFDKSGDIVEGEKEAFGSKSHFCLMHPNKLLIVDEVRNNTRQANDGNVGKRAAAMKRKHKRLTFYCSRVYFRCH